MDMRQQNSARSGWRPPPAGELHPMAKLTDDEIELLRGMYGQLDHRGKPYGQKRLAAIFEISRRSVRDILAGRRRP